MHLRDSDPLGDLSLRHVLEESERQYCPLAFGQCRQERTNRRDVEHLVEVGVEISDGVGDRSSVVVVTCPRRGVGGQRGIGAGGDLCLHHLIPVDAQLGGDFAGCRCPPQLVGSSSRHLLSCALSSLSRRGTLTDHPWSRKCRRTSPMIVGTANAMNSAPLSTSNRFTALIQPTRATWTRSSRGSPRFRKRRAMWSAKGRQRSTIASLCRRYWLV